MKVRNMTSDSGHAVANQFVIRQPIGDEVWIDTFQSYDSIIATITHNHGTKTVELDENYWDYSRTTGKYRNQFLGEMTADTRKKIKGGEYKVVDLN